MPGVYKQRRPEKTPLYDLLRDYVDELKSYAYSTHVASAYVPWRLEIDCAFEQYLKCGIQKYGVYPSVFSRCPSRGQFGGIEKMRNLKM